MNLFISNNLSFIFDPLSLFFIFVICLIGFPSLIYSVGYLNGQFNRNQIVLCQILTFLFLVLMCLVVTARNAILFLIAWEAMTLVSYFLVIFESHSSKSVNAGLIYIVMAHIGTAFLAAAFIIMYRYIGSFDLTVIKDGISLIPPNVKNILFVFFLIGFGTKAGIVPLHIWLPYAHPQAPSQISSLMSGVMIKTAIYGIIRFVIFIMGVQSVWWAIIVLIAAVISSLIGVIYALMEHDIKSLLAYHSVENIGIILFGIGCSMLFLYLHLPYIAVFALAAGLYHLINHAIFKGLLFLCAGSIYKMTGTRDIEKLGGMIKIMPWTAGAFLIGAMGISAVPPFNGFVSEWLTFQAFFLGARSVPFGEIKLFLGICAGVLALTGGLAAACFVKAFGITFLSLPRSESAKNAKEAPLSMVIGMAFLSILVILFGLASPYILDILAKISGSALETDSSHIHFSLNNLFLLPQAGQQISISPALLAMMFIGISALAVISFIFMKRKTAISKTWDCGYYSLSSRNEYSATGFSKPFRIAFSFFLRPYRKTERIKESVYHVKSLSHETHTTKVIKKYLYDNILGFVYKNANVLKKVQDGSIHFYISYIFAAALLLLLLRDFIK